MAGETINKTGAYATCIASAAIATSAFSVSPTTIVATVLTAEKDYPLLDFQLNVTAGTVTAGDVINLYRQASDGTTNAPAPSATNKSQYVGSFTIDSNSETRYFRGAVNSDNNDMFYLENTGLASITMDLKVRTRSYNAAA